MSDLISRADAIDACCRGWNNTAEDCIRNIKALPSAELPAEAEFTDLPDIPRYYYEKVVGNMAHEINMLKEQLESAEGEWIPCSVRLPSENECGWYLVTVKGHEVFVDVAPFNDELWKGLASHQEVIAWMPLPKPYREDGE